MRVSEGFNRELTERLDRLSFGFRKQTGGVSGGVRRSDKKGSSNEFSDFRSYTYGDSLRYVDWNSYARLGRLFVKLYTEEKQAVVSLLTDCSASMDFYNKAYVSGLLSASLCYAAAGGGDRARLYMGKGGSLSLNGKGRIGELLTYIDGAEYGGSFDIFGRVKAMSLNDKGKAIIISDFMYPVEETEQAIKYLSYKNQEVTAVMLTAPEESSPMLLSENGNYSLTLIDSETEERAAVNLNGEEDEDAIAAYEEAFKEHISALGAVCGKYGAVFSHIRAEDSFSKILLRVLSNNGG